MDAQLGRATLNGADVCWWTDHAERMDAYDYWTTGHCTSLTAQSPTGAVAKDGYLATVGQYRCNLGGQSISVDVMLEPGWEAGYMEVHVATSWHGTGTYTLSYRIVPGGGQP